jgi:hypothetical protein
MKNEEELQQRVEQGMSVEKTTDALAYKAVFKALQQEPAFKLSDDFSNNLVVNYLSIKKNKSYDYLWLLAGLTVLVIGAGVSAVIIGFKFNVGVFTFVSRNVGLVLFGIFFIIGLHVVDKSIYNKTFKLG